MTEEVLPGLHQGSQASVPRFQGFLPAWRMEGGVLNGVDQTLLALASDC